MKIKKPDDLDGLVPSFRQKVELLLAIMRRRGFNPVVVDGKRTQDEANANQAKGTGSKNSMHMWGVAADFADRDTAWAEDKFFDTLGMEAKRLGLCWGGDWKKPDRPHVQAIPATTSAQGQVRLCDRDDVVAVDTIVRGYLF